MLRLARANNHAIAEMPRYLNAQVSRGPEAVDTKCVSSLKLSHPQTAESDDAGTEKRRGRKIAERFRNGINEIFRRNNTLRVSAIAGPSSEQGIRTKILVASRAELADATGAMQPRHSNARPGSVLPRISSGMHYSSDDLVAGNHTLQFGRKLPFDNV